MNNSDGDPLFASAFVAVLLFQLELRFLWVWVVTRNHANNEVATTAFSVGRSIARSRRHCEQVNVSEVETIETLSRRGACDCFCNY